MSDRQTIFALASGAGRAGVAVIRVSGPAAAAALGAISGSGLAPARRAVRRRLRDPGTGESIDDALVLWFPGPGSYTGEDTAEFHVHGGRAVVGGLYAALAALPGLRPAAAGEFTRRAFENGRLDLTAAEGVLDIVRAETAAQRRQALRQLEGGLARVYDNWRRRLIRLLAQREAEIDFPEETAEGGDDRRARDEIVTLEQEIREHLSDHRRGQILRDGFHVAIVGAPNVGKSSLLNRLAGHEAAIVAAEPGTTRDVIEVRLDLGGMPVVLADTAGLRPAAGTVEAEGVRRARARAAAADLRLVVFDAAGWPATAGAARELVDGAAVVAVNKCDLRAVAGPIGLDGAVGVAVSARTGAGVAELLAVLAARAADAVGEDGGPALTRERHRRALEDCVAALARARVAALPELAAEDMRLAATALGRITGRVDVEDILDVVFAEFCIGK